MAPRPPINEGMPLVPLLSLDRLGIGGGHASRRQMVGPYNMGFNINEREAAMPRLNAVHRAPVAAPVAQRVGHIMEQKQVDLEAMPTSDRAHVVADAYMYKRFSARGGKQPEMVARDHVAPRPTSAGMMVANEVHGTSQKPAAAHKAFNFAFQAPPPRPQSAVELKQALFKVIIEAHLGPNKRHFHAYAKGSDSVASIKAKVSKSEGIPLPMFFRYKGNRLEDDRTMNDYPDIRDGCVVTMTRMEENGHGNLPFRPVAMDEMDYLRGDSAVAHDTLPSGKWGGEQENRVDNPHLATGKHRPMGAYEMRMAELDRKMKEGPRMIGGAPGMPVAGAPTGFNSSAKGHMGVNNPLLLARGRARPILLHSTTTAGTRIL